MDVLPLIAVISIVSFGLFGFYQMALAKTFKSKWMGTLRNLHELMGGSVTNGDVTAYFKVKVSKEEESLVSKLYIELNQAGYPYKVYLDEFSVVELIKRDKFMRNTSKQITKRVLQQIGIPEMNKNGAEGLVKNLIKSIKL